MDRLVHLKSWLFLIYIHAFIFIKRKCTVIFLCTYLMIIFDKLLISIFCIKKLLTLKFLSVHLCCWCFRVWGTWPSCQIRLEKWTYLLGLDSNNFWRSAFIYITYSVVYSSRLLGIELEITCRHLVSNAGIHPNFCLLPVPWHEGWGLEVRTLVMMPEPFAYLASWCEAVLDPSILHAAYLTPYSAVFGLGR